MIDINTLRIGSIVTLLKGEDRSTPCAIMEIQKDLLIVDAYYEGMEGLRVKPSNLEAIDLQAEILTTNSFKRDPENPDIYVKSPMVGYASDITFYIDTAGDVFQPVVKAGNSYMKYSVPIKHFHHLQSLYYDLTGGFLGY